MAALQQAVDGAAAPHLRVRLTLSRAGEVNAAAQPVELPGQDAVWRFALAETRLDPSNLFLYHKTTHRAFYDDERIRLAARTGCDEVVFLNTRGELTEGSFTSLFLEMGGELLTPALTSGLLPGTLREALIAEGRAREAVLTPDDLRAASAVYLGNSVRGLVRAKLSGSMPATDRAEAETAPSP
jgi:para-aminobenzoate synthetase/4-amino-4-deoxychorismate lyase